MPRQVTALAQWYGGDRFICPKIAELLKGCDWVGIPFAGGMSAIRAIRARTINANDLHRGIIALAEATKHSETRQQLQDALRRRLFHPDTLHQAQQYLYSDSTSKDILATAEAYFIVCWMTRSGSAGTDAEKTATLSTRWDSGGGDSAKRYYSAIESLNTWCQEFQSCNFTCLDAFEFLAKCQRGQIRW
jgi:DNA adenine methylase